MLPIYEYNGTLAGNLLENTDVINALNSSDSTRALSAAQGKVLDGKVIEINGKLFRLVKIYNNSEVVHFSAPNGFFDFLSKQNVIDKMGITEEQYNVNMLQFIAWNSDFPANNFYITGTMVDPISNILKFRFENGAGVSTAGRITYVLMLFSDNDEGEN